MPEDLIASRNEAMLLLGGAVLFALGFALFFLSTVVVGSGDETQAVGLIPGLAIGVGMTMACAGVALQILYIDRASRRLRPGRIGAVRRWWQQSTLGGVPFRPAVLRYAWHTIWRRS